MGPRYYPFWQSPLHVFKIRGGNDSRQITRLSSQPDYLANASLMVSSVFWLLFINKYPKVCPGWGGETHSSEIYCSPESGVADRGRAEILRWDHKQEASRSAEDSLPVGSSWLHAEVMPPQLPAGDDWGLNDWGLNTRPDARPSSSSQDGNQVLRRP